MFKKNYQDKKPPFKSYIFLNPKDLNTFEALELLPPIAQ